MGRTLLRLVLAAGWLMGMAMPPPSLAQTKESSGDAAPGFENRSGSQGAISREEREALEGLYKATDGEHWKHRTGWLPSRDRVRLAWGDLRRQRRQEVESRGHRPLR